MAYKKRDYTKKGRIPLNSQIKSDETKDFLGYIKIRLEKVSDGSYTLKELHSLIGSIRPINYFHTVLDKYCKTFNPKITKRGVNFYDVSK